MSAPMMMPILFMLSAMAGSQKAACACSSPIKRPLMLKMTGRQHHQADHVDHQLLFLGRAVAVEDERR